MLHLLLILPLAAALAAWMVPDERRRPLLLPIVGMAHLIITIILISSPQVMLYRGWISVDPLSKIFLLTTSTLFCFCAFYSVGYLSYRKERSNRVLCMGVLVCLSAMTLVAVARHLGLLWVAMETTTVTMAPLIYFNRNARSIEATWKYMLICSVSIALALLGLFFLAYSTMIAGKDATLLLDPLISQAPHLSPAWLKAAFVFLLVGFGTKMGLAPLHTWKPDAYGEAPGLVGALLAGGLVNCALLGLIRIYQICIATPYPDFFLNTLVTMGLVSMAFAAVFILKQSDFKRMLAYSSVEHVGILSVGLGLGREALFGALFHVINNCLTKGVLFLSSGNIHRSYNSKSCETVSGAMKRLPWSGSLFLAGFLAITGSPPFSPFVSEFTIIASAFSQGAYLAAASFLLCLTLVFIGMASTVLPVVMGKGRPGSEKSRYRESYLTVTPPLLLMGMVLMLGVWLPEPLSSLLREAAHLLEVRP